MIIINFEVKQWHEAVIYGIAIRLSLMMLIQWRKGFSIFCKYSITTSSSFNWYQHYGVYGADRRNEKVWMILSPTGNLFPRTNLEALSVACQPHQQLLILNGQSLRLWIFKVQHWCFHAFMQRDRQVHMELVFVSVMNVEISKSASIYTAIIWTIQKQFHITSSLISSTAKQVSDDILSSSSTNSEFRVFYCLYVRTNLGLFITLMWVLCSKTS